MKLFWRFSLLLCAAASFILGMNAADIQYTAAKAVNTAAPVRCDAAYYRDGSRIVAENVLVSFDGDTAVLSNGETVCAEFSEFTSKNPIRTAQNKIRTGVLSLLLGGIAAISIALAAGFSVCLGCKHAAPTAVKHTAHRTVRRSVAQLPTAGAGERRAA